MKKPLSFLTLALAVLLALCACGQPTEPLRDAYAREVKAQDVYPSDPFMQPFVRDTEAAYTEELLSAALASADASQRLRTLEAGADRVQALPVYGRQLEATSLTVLAFYAGEQLLGVLTAEHVQTENGTVLREFFAAHPDAPHGLNDAACERELARAIGLLTAERVCGMRFSGLAGGFVTAIGKKPGEDTLCWLAGEMTPFAMVSPFTTAKAGRDALAAFYTHRANLLSTLPYFAWEDKEALGDHFLYRYTQGDVSKLGRTQEELRYLREYDNSVEIPLLDRDGKENVYLLYLLFDGEDLLAEIVLERNAKDGSIRPVQERIAQKDSEGKYIPLQGIAFCTAFNDLWRYTPDASRVQGVTFNGETYGLYLGK